MKKRYESIEKPDKCPKCGAPVFLILYGLPVMPEEEYYTASIAVTMRQFWGRFRLFVANRLPCRI